MITMFGLSLWMWLKLNNNFYQVQPGKGAIWLQHLLYFKYAERSSTRAQHYYIAYNKLH